jgi:hypothetical protein
MLTDALQQIVMDGEQVPVFPFDQVRGGGVCRRCLCQEDGQLGHTEIAILVDLSAPWNETGASIAPVMSAGCRRRSIVKACRRRRL